MRFLLVLVTTTEALAYGAIAVNERSQFVAFTANHLTIENAVNTAIKACASSQCLVRKVFDGTCIAYFNNPVRIVEGVSADDAKRIAKLHCPECEVEVGCDR